MAWLGLRLVDVRRNPAGAQHTHPGLGGFIDEHHRLAGMFVAGERVLLVDVPQIHPIPALERQRRGGWLGRFRWRWPSLAAGVDLHAEHAGVRAGLGRLQPERLAKVHLELHRYPVRFRGPVQVEVGHLGNDAFPRLHAQQFVVDRPDTAVGLPPKLVRDRRDAAVEIGGL